MEYNEFCDKYEKLETRFEDLPNKLNVNKDLHLLLRLLQLFPDCRSLIAGADHNVIYLCTGVSWEDLLKLPDAILAELHGCGLCFNDDGLYTFA